MVLLGEVHNRPVRFIVECKSNGFPRDVRQAIWQLQSGPLSQRVDGSMCDVPMVASSALSAASRQLLREHGIGYLDHSGNVYLELPWALYFVDRPSSKTEPRPLRRPFRGSSAQVVHALLAEPAKAWHITHLAQRAQVQPSTAHKVCTWLQEQLWLKAEGTGPATVRRLVQPAALLDAWAEAHKLADYDIYRYHRWFQDDEQLLRATSEALGRVGVAHALTLVSGARLVAPHATDSGRMWLIVSSADRDRAAEGLEQSGFQEVEGGEAVTLFVTHERSPLMFCRQLSGYWVASDVQLYLDLWAWPQRGKEQARHLRAERLPY